MLLSNVHTKIPFSNKNIFYNSFSVSLTPKNSISTLKLIKRNINDLYKCADQIILSNPSVNPKLGWEKLVDRVAKIQ